MALPFCCEEEAPADVLPIDRLITTAFGQPAEACLVMRLRENQALAFSAVARLADDVIAHVACSEVSIGGRTTQPPVLALAPVGVEPRQQRRGYGSQLVRWSLAELQRRGFPAVIVLGEPAFYSRFGFMPASAFGIRCPFEVPDACFQALELQPGALSGVRGVVGYRREFEAVT